MLICPTNFIDKISIHATENKWKDCICLALMCHVTNSNLNSIGSLQSIISVIFISKCYKNSISNYLDTEARRQAESYGKDAGEKWAKHQAGGENIALNLWKRYKWSTGCTNPIKQSKKPYIFYLKESRNRCGKKWIKVLYFHHNCINSTNCWPKGKSFFFFQQSHVWLKQFNNEDYFLFSVVLYRSISVFVVLSNINPVSWCLQNWEMIFLQMKVFKGKTEKYFEQQGSKWKENSLKS